MATWPAQLPQLFEADTYSFAPGSGVIRTPMDAGPPKLRNRFTAVYDQHSGRMIMTRTQFTTYFKPFVRTTLGNGALTFDFPNPIDEGVTKITARFVCDTNSPPYKMVPDTPTHVAVAFTLEEL